MLVTKQYHGRGTTVPAQNHTEWTHCTSSSHTLSPSLPPKLPSILMPFLLQICWSHFYSRSVHLHNSYQKLDAESPDAWKPLWLTWVPPEDLPPLDSSNTGSKPDLVINLKIWAASPMAALYFADFPQFNIICLYWNSTELGETSREGESSSGCRGYLCAIFHRFPPIQCNLPLLDQYWIGETLRAGESRSRCRDSVQLGQNRPESH